MGLVLKGRLLETVGHGKVVTDGHVLSAGGRSRVVVELGLALALGGDGGRSVLLFSVLTHSLFELAFQILFIFWERRLLRKGLLWECLLRDWLLRDILLLESL